MSAVRITRPGYHGTLAGDLSADSITLHLRVRCLTGDLLSWDEVCDDVDGENDVVHEGDAVVPCEWDGDQLELPLDWDHPDWDYTVLWDVEYV